MDAFQPPVDKKAVRRFIGLYAYYRRFIEEFSLIDEPVTDLKKTDVEFMWKMAYVKGFHELTQHLRTPPLLAHYDKCADTKINTMQTVWDSALSLCRKLNDWKVISYACRALSKAEGNYSTT